MAWSKDVTVGSTGGGNDYPTSTTDLVGVTDAVSVVLAVGGGSGGWGVQAWGTSPWGG